MKSHAFTWQCFYMLHQILYPQQTGSAEPKKDGEMEQPSVNECQAALSRLGWVVSERPDRRGWTLNANRQGASFSHFGAERDQIWREILHHAVSLDGE